MIFSWMKTRILKHKNLSKKFWSTNQSKKNSFFKTKIYHSINFCYSFKNSKIKNLLKMIFNSTISFSIKYEWLICLNREKTKFNISPTENLRCTSFRLLIVFTLRKKPKYTKIWLNHWPITLFHQVIILT